MRDFFVKTEKWIIWGVAILVAYLLLRVVFFGFSLASPFPLPLVYLLSILFYSHINYRYKDKDKFIDSTTPEAETKLVLFGFIFASVLLDIVDNIEYFLGLTSGEFTQPSTAIFMSNVIGITMFSIAFWGIGILVRYRCHRRKIIDNEISWINWLHVVLVLSLFIPFSFMVYSALAGIGKVGKAFCDVFGFCL